MVSHPENVRPPQPGRPKGPPKRGRVVRLPKELDESLDIYSRIHRTPVSTIIEDLVRAWAQENRAAIDRAREAFAPPSRETGGGKSEKKPARRR
jgi:hypothetical protein